MLQKLQPAPLFKTQNQQQQIISLENYLGKQIVVLYFYPKDDTPGCTIEANDFTRLAHEFAQVNTVVIGVSKDSCESHAKFVEKYGLNLQLLADTNGELCESGMMKIIKFNIEKLYLFLFRYLPQNKPSFS
jgi:peroxiredoxin Q/BCP